MRAPPLVPLLLPLILASLAACSGAQPQQRGQSCGSDADCDPSDLCLSGQCIAEASLGSGSALDGDLTASPLQQTISAAVGATPPPATVTLADQDALGHQLAIRCTGGSANPATALLAASASLAVQVTVASAQSAGTSAASCTVTSASGATIWSAFVVTLHASGAGGGSGGGSAGGSGGGSAGGSGGGSAGGSGGGSAGGSGGGSAGGSGGGSAGGAGGGSAGGAGGGSAGGAGGGAAGGSGGGSAGGAGGGHAGGGGGSGGSGVGPTGGTVDHLYFAVIGDSRPANIDDPTHYPTPIVKQIYQDIQAMSPRPQFVISTGDYMYANTTTGTAAPQATAYMSARAFYSGTLFPAMGNHENDGYTADNCTPPPHTPPTSCTTKSNCACATQNYQAFIDTVLKPSGQSLPYYAVPISAPDHSWTAKLLVVACNAWDNTQSDWLTAAMAQSTTYTILARHESATASPAGPCQSAAEAIMAASSYDVSLVGHAHNFYVGTKEVTVGNGGAPLSAGYHGTYGYTTVEKISTGWQIKNYDYSTAMPVNTYVIQ